MEQTAISVSELNAYVSTLLSSDSVLCQLCVKGDIRTKNWEQLDHDIHEENYPNGIDPTGGKDGNNSLAHNGDRNYQVVIYDDTKYESLTFNVNSTNYTYYLGSWDPVFTNPTVDISSTTKENPTVYNTYLLENVLKFSAGSKLKEEIVNIKALDVPNRALTITKSGSEYTVIFKSNYYSEVTFEITGQSGGKYYLKINRKFLNTDININALKNGTETVPTVIAKFIYPDIKDYNDYDVIAVITNSDESIETRKLDAIKLSDWDQTVFPPVISSKFVWEAGIKLKETGFSIPLTNNVKNIQVTITNKNATTSNIYGGTFAGYGMGVALDFKTISILTNYAFGN